MNTATLTLDVLQLAAVQKALELSLINTQTAMHVIHGQVKAQIEAATPKSDHDEQRATAWKAHELAHAQRHGAA